MKGRRLDDLPFTPFGGQPAFAPGAIERFVQAPRIAVLGYVRADFGLPNHSRILTQIVHSHLPARPAHDIR